MTNLNASARIVVALEVGLVRTRYKCCLFVRQNKRAIGQLVDILHSQKTQANISFGIKEIPRPLANVGILNMLVPCR